MKKWNWLLAWGFFCLAVFADVRNADRPLKGEWDFRPQKVWEIDRANGAPLARPAELRAAQDETLVFRDFDQNVSYVFDRDGKLVNSFAKQGSGPGEVDRYLNCFIAGDHVVVGTPGALHFYSRLGAYVESYENNLFARFPLLFLAESEFLFTPQEMGQPQGDRIKIKSVSLHSTQEKVVAEFPNPGKGQANLPVIVLGLTPQVKVAVDPKAKKLFYGRSDEYSIHVADTEGTRMFSFGLERMRKSAAEDEKRKHFETSGIPKERYEKILPLLPGELTQFLGIQAVGNLIFVYPTESLDKRQDRIAVDIFSANGEYLYRAQLRFGDKMPLYTHVEKMALMGNHCYALLQDGSGRNFLAKYRISLPPAR